ncbi:anthranilate synthase component I family protein [Thermovibrio sp.]
MIVERLDYIEPSELFFSLKFSGYPVKLFLDSASLNPKTGEFSFIVVGSEEEFVLTEASSFEVLRELYLKLKERFATELPYGLFGFVSYDANRFIEKVPSPKIDDLKMPELCFVLPHSLLVFNNLKRELYLISHEPFKLPPLVYGFGDYEGSFLGSNMDEDYFFYSVEKIKEYIASGDTFQVNFSQRLEFSFKGDEVALYRKLRDLNPSPFSFYMDLGGFKAVSCSPERLLKVNGRVAETRPIAGTRRRGRSREEDLQLKRELLLSEKERAEHVMLVDLERNDLGRVCEYGTVEVDELMVLEEYSHVVHIVSNVKGVLREGITPVDALKALFPGGTITGAPKVRTMEIIAQLEPTRRALYTGSVGYLGFNGLSDFNIVIRTLLLKEGRGYLQVGAGIVWDSKPEREFKETLHKAEALLSSLKLS